MSGSPNPHRRLVRFAITERRITIGGAWVEVDPLACGILDHGFARVRRDAGAHEYLLAVSCTCRPFCPSCHAKRRALWEGWLEASRLAPVPHRQVVVTIPKRRRAYCR